MILLMPWKTSGMLAFLRYAYYLFEEKTIAVMTKFFFTLKLMRRAQVVEVSRYWWTSGRRMAHVLQNYVRILSDYKKSLFLRVGWNPQGFRKLFLWLLLPWHLFPGFGNHRWKSPEFWLQKCRSLTSFSSSEKDAKFEVCWSVVCCRDPLHWRISSNHFKEHCNW